MREEAAAQEALLIDFQATEAGKVPEGASGGPGWALPGPGFAPFPGAVPMVGPDMMPPPPYGYPMGGLPVFPPGATAPPVSPTPPTFNIPPNNLGSTSPPSSNQSSPGNKSLNTNNLQVNSKDSNFLTFIITYYHF